MNANIFGETPIPVATEPEYVPDYIHIERAAEKLAAICREKPQDCMER